MRARVVVTGLAGLAVVVGACWVAVPGWHDTRPKLTVAGQTYRLTFQARWDDALISTRTATQVTVRVDGSAFGCGADLRRPRAISTAHRVQIVIDVYGKPHRGPIACAGVGYLPRPVTVSLDAPLGARELVDADNRRHPVLDASGIPRLGRLPAGFHATPPTWDERSGVAACSYRRQGHFSTLTISTGPATALAQKEPGRFVRTTTTVGSSAATVYAADSTSDQYRAIHWRTADGRALRLDIAGMSPFLSLSDLRAVAAAVR